MGDAYVQTIHPSLCTDLKSCFWASFQYEKIKFYMHIFCIEQCSAESEIKLHHCSYSTLFSSGNYYYILHSKVSGSLILGEVMLSSSDLQHVLRVLRELVLVWFYVALLFLLAAASGIFATLTSDGKEISELAL